MLSPGLGGITKKSFMFLTITITHKHTHTLTHTLTHTHTRARAFMVVVVAIEYIFAPPLGTRRDVSQVLPHAQAFDSFGASKHRLVAGRIKHLVSSVMAGHVAAYSFSLHECL